MYTRKGKERKDKERRPAVSLLDSDDEERTRRGANLWSFRTRQAAADWNNLPDAGAQRAAERDGWLVPSRNRKNCLPLPTEAQATYLASPVQGRHLWPAGTTRARDWATELVVVAGRGGEDWANGTGGCLQSGPWAFHLDGSLPYEMSRCDERTDTRPHHHCASDWNYYP